MAISPNDLHDLGMSGRSGPGSVAAGFGINGTGGSSQPRSYPHIRDLVAGAEGQVDPYTSVGSPSVLEIVGDCQSS